MSTIHIAHPLADYNAVAAIAGHRYAELRRDFLAAVATGGNVETPAYHSKHSSPISEVFFDYLSDAGHEVLLRILQRAAEMGDTDALLALDTTARTYAEAHQGAWL